LPSPASAHHTTASAIPVTHHRRCSDRPLTAAAHPAVHYRHHRRRRLTLPAYVGRQRRLVAAAAVVALAVMGNSGWQEQWR